MNKLLPVAIFAILFLAGACSTESDYQVNPSPNIADEGSVVPEVQQNGYMRIIGNLRWDRLRTPDDWKRRFPGCFEVKPLSMDTFLVDKADWEFTRKVNLRINECRFDAGGIQFYMKGLQLSDDVYPGISRIAKVRMVIDRGDQKRAFIALIKSKYQPMAIDNATRYCSRWTCFSLEGDPEMLPSEYALSILDRVNVDSSQF